MCPIRDESGNVIAVAIRGGDYWVTLEHELISRFDIVRRLPMYAKDIEKCGANGCAGYMDPF